MKKSPFYKEAELVVTVIPEISKEKCFALKGGTAINLFWREMPRLSVDIDLTYLPIEDRGITLLNISSALERIALSIEKIHRELRVQRSLSKGTKRISKLVVSNSEVRIKVESNEVIRGRSLWRSSRKNWNYKK